MGIFEQVAVVQVKLIAAAIGPDYSAATYTPPGGGDVTCSVVINESTETLSAFDGLTIGDPDPEAIFLKSEVDPVKDAALVVGARTWRIVDIRDDDSHAVTVSVREIFA